MKLDLLTELELQYRGAFTFQAAFGKSGVGYGEGVGRAIGERLRGSVRWSNHPSLREDEVFLPDGAGVIDTHDGAAVVFRMRGYSVLIQTGGRERAFTLAMTFQSAHENYRMLNSVFCVGEGVIDMQTMVMHVRVFACVHAALAGTDR
jgi:hypothetical protein